MKMPQEAFMKPCQDQMFDLYNQKRKKLEQKEKFVYNITSIDYKLSYLDCNGAISNSFRQISKEE